MGEVNRKLHFISYSDLNKWDAKFYLTNETIFNPKYKQVLFGEFLKKASIEKVKIEDDKYYKILGVRSYGKGVYLNRESLGKDLKMKEYFKAKPDHLFWCKVDTKNGAFGVVNKELADGFGSSNMTFAEIDTKKISLDFLQLLFKSKKIHSYLDSFVTGTTNRKYIRPDQLLEEIYIPLPTITEQQEIVDSYYANINEADNLELEANNLDQEIEKYLYEELGISIGNQIENKKGLNFVYFKDILEWGTDKILSSSGFETNQYKLKSLSKYDLVVEDVFRGKSPKYAEKSNKYILNQKCNRWNKIEIKYAKTVIPEWYDSIEEKFFTKEGDIIINSTGEGTIGRSSYVSKEFEGLIYDSHILLLRINKNLFNPELFVELFNSSFGQSQVNQIKSAQATKQTELGVNNLLKIEIPVVENLQKQDFIIEEIKRLRVLATDNFNKIELLKHLANEEFEKVIFQIIV
ncbi:restriction endonuclease subunit S [Chryseobacterium sp. RP-3-3]|uniref:Restriction endonuclease subunit S n=1 Tax=Chryseobacterium antibioticum TaxID=2728847 RepID=A0A7Y0FTB6_9FLAO|nr:restriction endonuclease subunit S [Chryseobacterium antibioticum]NML72118.1 restriction endonuclease subunit S [Chryseobacterium antibioticum]